MYRVQCMRGGLVRINTAKRACDYEYRVISRVVGYPEVTAWKPAVRANSRPSRLSVPPAYAVGCILSPCAAEAVLSNARFFADIEVR